MRIIIFSLLLAAKVCAGQSAVPGAVTSYLETYLREWRMCRHEDYDKSFWSFYNTNTLPFFTAVDINDDNKIDYCVLVRKKNELRLVILLSDGKGFRHWLSDKFPGSATQLQYCLLPEPPGRMDVAYPVISSLILTNNALNVMQMENRACIYYWDGTAISVFLTM
ncbi:hypothetical protein [Chitinophaga tropicalis]|uniref:VCBS repeat-containing protein n=1 Tax=Chitinophaga tropicalis TaxID=2683588 RepID=A0A7K1U4Q6_9BACT|nr:hypothetical protein [Chitinophaga tropicalis]MVT09319.1 hypothetical protein [Chitinophaga tropicalis]